MPKPALLYWDASRKTCLRIHDAKGVTRYVTIQTAASLKASTMKTPAFEVIFKPVPDYPANLAAKLFLRYAQDLGATVEVLDALAKHTPVTKQARAVAMEVAETAASRAATKPKTAAY